MEIRVPDWTGAVCTDSFGSPLRPAAGQSGLGAAADIGTTSVAVRLFDLSDGRLLGTESGWNAQAPYGADVITRIQYVMDHPNGLAGLSETIRHQVAEMLRRLCSAGGARLSDIRRLSLAGNTVMQHLFAGISPVSIAAAPFTPATCFEEDREDRLEGIPVEYSPCVAGYVGGDITAGLLAADLPGEGKKILFLDVGTNGEMALAGPDGILCCAVASGPAFEGAGITCGMAGTEGAISAVRWEGRTLGFETLGGVPPRGLCGSGLLDLVACLLERRIVDETGWLMPPEEAPGFPETFLREDEDGNGRVFLTEDIYLTAGDIRQLQLAKAAVAAGIRILLRNAETDVSEVDALYLAGGFGTNLSARSAAAIGMIPPELAERTVGLGNTALAGAAMALLDPERRAALSKIRRVCRYLELSGSAEFNMEFVSQMGFEREESPWK